MIIRACLAKELRLIRRSWRTLGTVFIFSLLLAVTASVALRVPGLAIFPQRAIFLGAYLLILVYSGTVLLASSWEQERRDLSFLGGVLAAGDAWPALAAKIAVQTVLLSLVGGFALCALSLLFPFPIVDNVPTLAVFVFLASAGYAGLGSILCALSSAARDRDLIFPILLFPLLMPFVWALASLGTGILDGVTLSLADPRAIFVVAFDVISIALAMILFPFVIEE